MKITYSANVSTTAPKKLRINLAEKALVWSYLNRLNAWLWPTEKLEAGLTTIQVMHPDKCLNDETEAARRYRQQMMQEVPPLTISR